MREGTLPAPRERDVRDLPRLLFRRQFLLGPEPFAPTPHWTRYELRRGMKLSLHRDLHVAHRVMGRVEGWLLGVAVDPFDPGRHEGEILEAILERGTEPDAIVEETRRLSGRWLLLLQDDRETVLVPDPCALRQVFYCHDGAERWCGSQPQIIRAARHMGYEDDEDLFTYLERHEFALHESPWVGSKTLYRGCSHLLPNHLLRVEEAEAVRFHPRAGRNPVDPAEAVDVSVRLLQGTMSGLAARNPLNVALTAGWDSRVLLAASRPILDRLRFYVDRKGVLDERHEDVWVPLELADRLGLDFTVRNSSTPVPGWFGSLLAGNVSGARVLPKTRMIYGKYLRRDTGWNVNGNVSEICRNYFDPHLRRDPTTVTVDDLVSVFGFPSGDPYVKEQLREWQEGLPLGEGRGPSLLDYLYWEQRLGNWGAQYPAEQDIAVEELSPFNCRALIEVMSSTAPEVRRAPDYLLYRDLIETMWSEAMALPVNPGDRPRDRSLLGRVRGRLAGLVARLT